MDGHVDVGTVSLAVGDVMLVIEVVRQIDRYW